MKKLPRNQEGFSLTEALVAAAIMAALALGAASAFKYFNNSSKSELDRLGDVGDFTNVAKDLLKFTEGAGVSTAYLNIPVLTKGCVEGLPCVRKQLGDSIFGVPDESDLPEKVKELNCTQFYKEGQGFLVRKGAFPSLGLPDVVTLVNDMEVKVDPTKDLYAHWILKDPASPPFLMMKTMEGGIYLSMFKKPAVEHSRSANEAKASPLQHAFFESDASADKVFALKGKPFLIFNTVYPSHFAIQYADDILDCTAQPGPCLTELNKINAVPVTDLNAALDPQSGFRIYAVHFRPIAMTGEEEKSYPVEGVQKGFFSRIRESLNLPTECRTAWSMDSEQGPDEFFFPSKVFSVSNMAEAQSDVGPSAKPLNVLHLNHYYGSDKMKGVAGTMDRGLIVSVPIEISTYAVEKNIEGGGLDLVGYTWDAADIKRNIRIRDLKGAFQITRKLGSSEMGLWYNPLGKQQKQESKP